MTEDPANRSARPSLPETHHLDELLDEALEETFPASDPVAIRVERRPSEPQADDRSRPRFARP
ncbi:MAG TPA: hypothetical protein VMU67_08505 [Steroidobacteraceae bacterium]|nr:hypothetical protein [Steroidobacteraceae bacterium]